MVGVLLLGTVQTLILHHPVAEVSGPVPIQPLHIKRGHEGSFCPISFLYSRPVEWRWSYLVIVTWKKGRGP